MKQKKSKLIRRVTFIVLVLMSLSCLGSCGIFDISNSTTTSVLRTTVPNTLDFSDAENTFETTSTVIELPSGEVIAITHGRDFNEDDIEFLLMLHGKTRNDWEEGYPPPQYKFGHALTAIQGGQPFFLAHFENPYIICAYLKINVSDYETDKQGNYNFDISKYIWYKFYNSTQVVDEIERMKRTEDSYLLYDCIVKKFNTKGIEYSDECKYYINYTGEYTIKKATIDMLLYYESSSITEDVFFIPYPQYAGAAFEVYVDKNGVEYVYFAYRVCDESGIEYENFAKDSLCEHYDCLAEHFEILNESVNEDGSIFQYAGIRLTTIMDYISNGG